MAGNQISAGLYVAVDGSYGDAAGMTIINDTDWIESDYSILEENGDHRRADLADAIDTWVKEGRPELFSENVAEALLEKYSSY
jgi:hypothetical protein